MKNDSSFTKSLFLNRSFIAIFFSQACVYLGDQFLIVALSWTVAQEMGGFSLGLVLAAWSIPRGILLFIGGVFADRYERKKMGMIIAGSVSLVALLIACLIINEWFYLPLWIGTAIILGTLDALRLPLGASLVPLVLPKAEIINANRWIQLLEYGSLSAGAAIAGIVVASVGSMGAFIIIGCLFIVSIIFFSLLPTLPPNRETQENMVQDLKEGFKWVISERRLRVLLPTFALANLFVLGIYSVGIVLFAKNIAGNGAQNLGFMSSSFGIGLVVGILILPVVPKKVANSLAGLFMLFLLSDISLALIGLGGNLLAACGFYFLSGLFAGPASTLYRSSLQLFTPDHLLGRVNSIARGISFGLEPVSTSIIGALSSILSAGTLIIVGGFAAATVDTLGVLTGRLVEKKDNAKEEFFETIN
ncbi:MFS transporter [Bacillus cytotoxicus]|uniref:MFS transporter n=1 Tax=Bacillus cytotoxicus TaxID=580165 RepID=UPI001AEDFE9B|nr:MFS transporter [Bacillus cytotoxicus]QTR72651.1 MFS transporter [Bacillus cytotoxicus]HDR7315475.1 MFS transporter [Bacillus cytotoxicus]